MVKKIAEKFNRLSMVHQRCRQTDDRQTTDGIATAISEREREFTSAKNLSIARSLFKRSAVVAQLTITVVSSSSWPSMHLFRSPVPTY